jgi:hypothetical protein
MIVGIIQNIFYQRNLVLLYDCCQPKALANSISENLIIVPLVYMQALHLQDTSAITI